MPSFFSLRMIENDPESRRIVLLFDYIMSGPLGSMSSFVLGQLLKGAFLPHSWEDINPEINFSQMLHSARIYQLLLKNVLCCIQTAHTDQQLHC